jgi:hypothetical protein
MQKKLQSSTENYYHQPGEDVVEHYDEFACPPFSSYSSFRKAF